MQSVIEYLVCLVYCSQSWFCLHIQNMWNAFHDPYVLMTVYDMSYLCGCVQWGSKLWTMLDFYSIFRHVVPPRWSWTKEKFSSQHHLSLKKMRGWSWKLSTCSCRVFQWFLVFHPKCRCTNSDANSKFMPRDRVPSLDGTDTMVNSAWWLPRVAFQKPFGRGVECAPLGSKGNYRNKMKQVMMSEVATRRKLS